MTPRTSLTPADSADIATNRRPVAIETRLASVVLPVPGGPYSSTDAGAAPSTSRRSGAPSRSRCCWPTTSSSVRGRIRTASGELAGSACGSTRLDPVGSGGGPTSGFTVKSSSCAATRMTVTDPTDKTACPARISCATVV